MEKKDKELITKHKDKIFGKLEKFIEEDNSKSKINFDDQEEINHFIVKYRTQKIKVEINEPNKTMTLYAPLYGKLGKVQSTFEIYKK